MEETNKALMKCLAAIPRGIKPKNILSDNGSEYQKDFKKKVNGQGIVLKYLPPKTPGKHIERLNRSIRDAATKFRTTYGTKRIKDFVLTFIKRYNK